MVGKDEEVKKLLRAKDDQLEILGIRVEAGEKDAFGELAEAKREFERLREVSAVETQNLLKIVAEKDQEIHGLRGLKHSLETNLKSVMNVSSDETKKIEMSLRDKTNEISRLIEKISAQKSEISGLEVINQNLASTAQQDTAEITRLKQESKKHQLDFAQKLKEKASQVEDYKKKIGKNVELLDKKIRSNDDEIRSYKRKIGEKDIENALSLQDQKDSIAKLNNALKTKEDEFRTYSLSESAKIKDLSRKLSERDDQLSRFSLDKSEFTLQMNKILEDKEGFITAQAAEHRKATADLELQLNARTEELYNTKKSKVGLEDKLKSVDGEYKAKFFESQSEISALKENLKMKSEELLEKENYSNNLSKDMTSKIRD